MNDFLKECGISIEKVKEENVKSNRKEYAEIFDLCEKLYKWKTFRYQFKSKADIQGAVTRLVLIRKEWDQNLRPLEKEYDASVYNLVNATLKLISKQNERQA